MFDDKTILITGGTGLYGKKYAKKILEQYSPKKIIIFSRGELKQFEMQKQFDSDCMRYFLGDVRDAERLFDAMQEVDYVIHAASMKQLDAAEFNPFECIKTNIVGAENVVKAAIKNNVKKVIAISIDKVANPTGLNDATKLASEKLFVAANNMVGRRETRFSVVRYCTLSGEDEEIVKWFESTSNSMDCNAGCDSDAKKYLMLVERGVEFTLKNFERMQGGETFVPKLFQFETSSTMMPESNDPSNAVNIVPYDAMMNVDPNLILEFEDHYVICPTIQFANISDFTQNKLGEVGKHISYGRQDINQADINSVVEVLRSDFLTQGPKVPLFESKLARYCNAEFAVAVNSATSALHIACLALGLEEGDWLWTSANTFVASSNCGLYCGAKIDFVDIDPRTFNMCADELERKLIAAKNMGRLPKIVIPVHFAGQSCEMKRIRKLADQYGFKIIEDASHAIGGRYLDQPIGGCQYSDIAVFSFHPVKIITTAEGGIALTNDSKLAEAMQLLRSHGITRDQNLMTKKSEGDWYYQQISLGYNYRMTEMQAALGVSQLDRLNEFVSKRHILRESYETKLRNLPLSLPYQHPDCYSSIHLYPVQLCLSDIDKTHSQIFRELRNKGLGVNLHYIPVYTQPFYESMGVYDEGFPNAQEYYSKTISIPMYQSLAVEQQNRVVEVLEQVLAKSS